MLVQGTFGAGHVAVYTGFTPVIDARSKWTIDERVITEASSRAYFAVFSELLGRVLFGSKLTDPAILVQSRIQPLYELLSAEPRTKLVATVSSSGAQVDDVTKVHTRTMTIRNEGGFAHAVHLRIRWMAAAPFYTSLSDNDFDLTVGETKMIQVKWKGLSQGSKAVGELSLSGPNLDSTTVALEQ